MDLPEFDISSVPRHAAVLLLGKRGTGKTHLARAILREHGLETPCIEASCDMLGFRTPSAPRLRIAGRDVGPLDSAGLDAALRARLAGATTSDWVFLDDPVVRGVAAGWALSVLLLNGRAAKTGLLFAAQSPPKLSKNLAANFDYVVVFSLCRSNDDADLRSVYHRFVGGHPAFATFEAFRDAHAAATAGPRPWCCAWALRGTTPACGP